MVLRCTVIRTRILHPCPHGIRIRGKNYASNNVVLGCFSYDDILQACVCVRISIVLWVCGEELYELGYSILVFMEIRIRGRQIYL
ncbi:hypothetical protein L2E82_04857 [Cichorium intybus]|uniref:Uncharacterized protein n=1 Tax=Cichorium intybus TaxID=13427 RepID=A0ACB9H600_CICIN|nr:hypothetical protein L2E82_04857 [Cichorium intybus]